MTKPTKDEEEVPEVAEKTVEEKPKAVPPKPPISRNGPAFPQANQFRGSQAGAMNNRQRPGRAANRGR